MANKVLGRVCHSKAALACCVLPQPSSMHNLKLAVSSCTALADSIGRMVITHLLFFGCCLLGSQAIPTGKHHFACLLLGCSSSSSRSGTIA